MLKRESICKLEIQKWAEGDLVTGFVNDIQDHDGIPGILKVFLMMGCAMPTQSKPRAKSSNHSPARYLSPVTW